MGFLTSRQHALTRLLLLVGIYVTFNAIVFIYKRSQIEQAVTRTVDEDGFPDGDILVTTREPPPNANKRRLILLWNPFFKAADYKFGTGHEPFLIHKCPVSSCETTTNRSLVTEADAVVFHGPRIEDFPPAVRPQGQIYIYMQEKPNYNPSVALMDRFNGHMNLTVTNRRDSDIEFPHALVHVNREVTSVSRRLRRSIRGLNPNQRPRSVVWVAHRCSTPSRREWYVKELKKHVDVDVFGECGSKRCREEDGEEDQECLDFFEKKYLFYLALEYDVCRDYASEKIFKAFKKQIIPIVFGGANYSSLAPPHSVIDIRDYPHPRDLAEYLRYLSSNKEAYNAYFAWKYKGYNVETGREAIMGQNFCNLCRVLNDPEYKYRSSEYANLKDWWLDGICDASVIPRMRRTADW